MCQSTDGAAPVNAEETAPECSDCGETDCGLWGCGGCDRECCGASESPCACCAECPDCCECRTCSRSRCSEPFADSDACVTCERCPNCCGCVTCDRCGKRHHDESYDTRTDESGNTYCDGCWPYDYCGNCGGDVDSTCSDCDRCDNCCTCNGEERNVRLLGQDKPTFHSPRKAELRRNPSARFLSCELECSGAAEGESIHRAAKHWGAAIVEDGSLPNSGFEVCTAPAGGDCFLEQIEELTSAFRSQSAEVNSDCGYHVHADARDLNWWDIRRLVLLYERVESALYGVIPPSRRKSSYCRPCGATYADAVRDGRGLKGKLLSSLYGINQESKGKGRGAAIRNVRKEKYNSARYHALNLHSWLYRGTVECRLAAGTTDRAKIVNWALLWGAIVDFAAKRTDKDLANLPADPWQCLLAIAPSDDVRNWLEERHAKFAATI